jgi:hypothetical protein
LQGENLLLLN